MKPLAKNVTEIVWYAQIKKIQKKHALSVFRVTKSQIKDASKKHLNH